ncbi:MAG: MgtC/SapB family protein [archaeon]
MVSAIILKFLVIFLMSFLFGVERQVSKKPVGFGTFVFVSVGSCALGIAALEIAPTNPLPLLSAIVTGIGFLGAGALIKSTDKIYGFTSAASIWVFSIIGLLVGIGDYNTSLITYAIVWIVILTDKYLESMGSGTYNKKITIETKSIVDKTKILEIFGKRKVRMIYLSTNRDKKRTIVTYIVSLPRKEIKEISDKLIGKKWVHSFVIE